MIRIGITGDLRIHDAPTLAWVRGTINQVLGEHHQETTGVSSLAAGIEQAFATLVLERRGAVDVVAVPNHRGLWIATNEDRTSHDSPIKQARIRMVACALSSEDERYLREGLEIVARCDLLLVIWDVARGDRSAQMAGIVGHARELNRAVVIIDPMKRTITRTCAPAQSTGTSRLDHRALDIARRIGDPLVDPLVLEHATLHGPESIRAVTASLFCTRGLPVEQPLVSAYGEVVGDVELGDPAVIARGQRLFALFGPEIFLVLGSCSLPLAFAAGNGVQAIFRARRLKDDPVRRLYDTAQMVINVMQVGELARGNIGWHAARKVRLIHGLIRWHVQQDIARPWLCDWGLPINQEDLAGTLLSFSAAVLHGLRMMGARISVHDADAYIYAWSAVGRLLGVDEALLAATEDDAQALALRIGERQFRATPEGKQLAAQLMAAVATLFPVPGYANCLTHFFLSDTAFGQDIARVLELPPPNWTSALVAARAWQKRRVLRWLDIVPGARRRRSFLVRRFVQNMILTGRPDGEPPFEVPDNLARRWRVPPGRGTGAASEARRGGRRPEPSCR